MLLISEKKVEYEGVSKYCNHSRLQGHEISQLERELGKQKEKSDNEQANGRNIGVQENEQTKDKQEQNHQLDQKGKGVKKNDEANQNASTNSQIADIPVTRKAILAADKCSI